MTDQLIYSIAIGLAVGAFLYVGVSRRFDDPHLRRPLAVGSFGLGCGIAWWLQKHDWKAEELMAAIVDRGLLILFAVLAAALIFWKIRALKP